MVQRKGSSNGTRSTVHCEVTIRVSRGDGVEDILRNTCIETWQKKQKDSEEKMAAKGLQLQNFTEYLKGHVTIAGDINIPF